MTYQHLLDILEREKVKRRITVQVLTLVFAGVFVGIVILAIFGRLQFNDLASLGFPLFLGWIAAYRFTPQAKTALVEAAKSGDQRLIGHLSEALTCGDPALVKIAREALQSIFHHMDEETVPLDKVQHAAFIHGIHDAIAEKNFGFASAAVRALAILGRPQSIPTLESLADPYPTGFEKVQHAALETLPNLRMRLAKEIILRKIDEMDELRSEQVDKSRAS